jgi:Ni,Fe-hydrogenase III small subunit
MAFVPAPEVMLPPVMVQPYVPPLIAGTDAVALVPLQKDAGAVIVASGSAFTVTVSDDVAEQLLAFVTVMPRETVVPVEVKVMAFVPAPEVMLPPVMVQPYVPPLIAGTDAVALVPLQKDAGAVIVASGSAFTVTVFEDVAEQLLAFVTLTPTVTLLPVEVKVTAFVPAPEAMLPPVMVQP